MGFSRVGQGFGAPARTSLTHRNYTDVIVSSEAMRPHFAEGFGIPLERIHATGVPRSDFFFDGDAQDLARDRLFAQLPQLRDHRIILFAPTYRTGVNNRVGYPLEFLDLDRIGQTLGEGDLFIIKNHPLVAESWEIPPQYADKILDLSSFEEFNHLLLVSDLLITDYSSAIFDNALLKNPVVFYTPDFEVYDGARGFYYPFDQYVYGPVVHDLNSLVALIPGVDIDEPRWSEFCELFLNSCDGRATQRFIETVFSPSVSQREGEGS
jgi:CDP-ribitol ribitolphosphotransferase